MDEIEKIIRDMCAYYKKTCTSQTVDAFRRAVDGLDVDVVRSAAHRWVASHPRGPTPDDFRASCGPRRPPGQMSGAIVCQDCGERVEAAKISRHSDIREGWCEAIVRRRCGDPPIDRYLVHLRGLANITGSKEHAQNLADYLASRVPAKAGVLQESF